MTLDWLILILLVPAILVPVVLLWGFAGCGFTAGAAGLVPPTNLVATGTGANTIHLTWDDSNSNSPSSFRIERTREGETIPVLRSSTTNSFDDGGLLEATTYFYRVAAVRMSDNYSSGLSDQAAGRTIGVAFEATFTTDQPGLDGGCLVQRIEPTRLRQSTLAGDIQTLGARVRITVRGATNADLRIDRITISQPAASGDPYDSAADLTPVADSVLVPKNTAVALPLIDYDLVAAAPLLIAFDINATPGLGNVRFVTGVPPTEATFYFRASTAEAAVNDRSPSAANPGAPPYQTAPGIYLVERIEVV